MYSMYLLDSAFLMLVFLWGYIVLAIARVVFFNFASAAFSFPMYLVYLLDSTCLMLVFLWAYIVHAIARVVWRVPSIQISSDLVPEEPCSFEPPFDALHDECLFEVLRRLSGRRERSASASVSKRWLMLLSTIRTSELCASTTNQQQSRRDVNFRVLWGKRASDMRLAAVAGLVKLNLTYCVNITDNAVLTIASFHGETLVVLILAGCGCITDVSLVAIAKNCTALTEVDVSLCGITDYGISAVCGREYQFKSAEPPRLLFGVCQERTGLPWSTVDQFRSAEVWSAVNQLAEVWNAVDQFTLHVRK